MIGFDIERHDYGTGGYPGQLVLQDVTTLHGSQFKDAAVIVASPPCEEFSYYHRFRAKAPDPKLGVELFKACFRIQREAGIPMVVENVIGAQRWIGRARAHWGAYYLWGDVPTILPHRRDADGIKGNAAGLPGRFFSSKSLARKRATAQTAKIPFPLAQHIARVFKPDCGVSLSHEVPGPLCIPTHR